MLFKELLAESMLIENLGNLGSLGLGKMVNAFKQQYYYHSGKRSELRASDVKSKFTKNYHSNSVIGHNSTVDKLGTVSSWNEFKRKAGDKMPVGAILRVDGNVVVTLVLQKGGASVKDYRAGDIIGVAFDLKKVFNAINPHDSDKLSDEMVRSGLIVNGNTRDASTRVETNRWDDRTRKYEGVAVVTKNVVTFVNTLASVVTLEAELIMTGESDRKKRDDRFTNRPIEPKDVKLFKDDLRARLAKYKATKLVNVDDVQQLVNLIFSNNGAFKKINFQGQPYNLVPDIDYVPSASKYAQGGYSDFAMKLFTGKEVIIRFSGDSAAQNYDTLYLTIQLVNGAIKPVKIRVNGKEHTL